MPCDQGGGLPVFQAEGGAGVKRLELPLFHPFTAEPGGASHRREGRVCGPRCSGARSLPSASLTLMTWPQTGLPELVKVEAMLEVGRERSR